MGKEWDRLASGRAAKYAKGSSGMSKGGFAESNGYANRKTPSYVNRPAKRCAKCGKQAWSGSPCKCDPPEWELDNSPLHAAQEWHQAWATEALRVLKPGGHLLAFGGTRTYHRLACAIEDAGFEIRDSLMWLYGSGFPKSLDVSKAMDKAAGVEREVVGVDEGARARRLAPSSRAASPFGLNGLIRWGDKHYRYEDLPAEGRAWFDAKVETGGQTTAPAIPEAQQWNGWGTALKPSHEPIVLARKPLVGTVAQNVLEHGTGALNVDGCRIGTGEQWKGDERPYDGPNGFGPGDTDGWSGNWSKRSGSHSEGRWPPNLLLSHHESCRPVGVRRVKSGTAVNRNREEGTMTSWLGTRPSQTGDDQTYADPDGLETIEAWECATDEQGRNLCPVRELDGQSGTLTTHSTGQNAPSDYRNTGMFGVAGSAKPYGGDSGGASRFFYVAKSSRSERNAGLEGFEERLPAFGNEKGDGLGRGISNTRQDQPRANHHPTVKPIALMRWLCRLVTPPNGTVLDPFTGSGTTGIAATLEGFDFIGIEREEEYVEIARARIAFWAEHGDEALQIVADQERAEEKREEIAESGQGSFFD